MEKKKSKLFILKSLCVLDKGLALYSGWGQSLTKGSMTKRLSSEMLGLIKAWVQLPAPTFTAIWNSYSPVLPSMNENNWYPSLVTDVMMIWDNAWKAPTTVPGTQKASMTLDRFGLQQCLFLMPSPATTPWGIQGSASSLAPQIFLLHMIFWGIIMKYNHPIQFINLPGSLKPLK